MDIAGVNHEEEGDTRNRKQHSEPEHGTRGLFDVALMGLRLGAGHGMPAVGAEAIVGLAGGTALRTGERLLAAFHHALSADGQPQLRNTGELRSHAQAPCASVEELETEILFLSAVEFFRERYAIDAGGRPAPKAGPHAEGRALIDLPGTDHPDAPASLRI